MTATKSRASKAADRLEQDRIDREAEAAAPGDPQPGALSPDLDAAATDYDAILTGDGAGAELEASTDDEVTEAEGSQDPEGLPEGGETIDDPEEIKAETETEGDPEAGSEDGTGDDTPAADETPAEAVTPRSTKAKARAGKAPKAAAEPKTPKPPKVRPQPGLCLCGCGETCVRPQAQFVRGHDSLLAKELRAAYAAGDMTAEQVREHAGMVSAKFLGKLGKSIAAVDAERAQVDAAAEARSKMLEASRATVTAKTAS